MANSVYSLAGWHSELYVDADDLEGMSTLLAGLPAMNPDSLLLATDLPSTRATVPFQDSDVAIIVDLLGEAGARKVFIENGIQFYSAGKPRFTRV